MTNEMRRIRKLADDDANAAMTSGFIIAGALTFILLSVVLFTDVPIIGPNEGELAPNLVGDVHMIGASDWTSFELYDEIDNTWDAETSPNQNWFLIQFMDSDCPYCFTEAETMTALHQTFSDQVTFISVGVSLNIPGHESTVNELIAFQEQTSMGTCKGGETDCASRPGSPHDWAYFDDLRGTTLDTWGVSGTPFIVILQPDGVVAWNQGQHQGEEVGYALADLLPDMEAA